MNDVRLLYVSKFKSKTNPVSELCDILAKALDFNSLNKIYGALYRDGSVNLNNSYK